MLLIKCPYCEEERPELEFRHAGQAHIERPSNLVEISADEMEEFLFIRENKRGVMFERWRHINGCARYFNCVRDTVTDDIAMTYKSGEPKPSDEVIKNAFAALKEEQSS